MDAIDGVVSCLVYIGSERTKIDDWLAELARWTGPVQTFQLTALARTWRETMYNYLVVVKDKSFHQDGCHQKGCHLDKCVDDGTPVVLAGRKPAFL